VLEAAKKTLHLYSVPGVINSTGIGAFLSCTNPDKANVTIGVEISGSAGGAAVNDAAGTVLFVLETSESENHGRQRHLLCRRCAKREKIQRLMWVSPRQEEHVEGSDL
jgi:nicotinamide mononucleotide (NMN) deamidase PncC